MSALLRRQSLARQILALTHELRTMPRHRSPHPLAILRRQLTHKRSSLITQLHALTHQRITQTLLHKLATPPHKTLNI